MYEPAEKHVEKTAGLPPNEGNQVCTQSTRNNAMLSICQSQSFSPSLSDTLPHFQPFEPKFNEEPLDRQGAGMSSYFSKSRILWD